MKAANAPSSAMTEENWPRELKLVVLCVKAGFCLGEDVAAPTDLLRRDKTAVALDWERFFWWVERHRVTPLVHLGFKQLAALPVPWQVREGIRERADNNVRRMLMLGGELVQLLRAFERAGIRALPLKGPALALQIHGDMTLRQVRDLDFLLDAENIDRAMDLLLGLGYRLHPDQEGFEKLSARKKAVWESHKNQCCLLHRNRPLILELHWNAMRELLPAQLSDFWGRRGTLNLGGVEIPVPHKADLIPYLAIHGVYHSWRRLSWLVELACLVPKVSAQEWNEICDSVEVAGIRQPLVQAILVSNRLFETRIPVRIRGWLQEDSRPARLAEHALEQMALERDRPGPGIPSIRNIFYLAQLKTDLRFRLRIFHRFFLCPSDFKEVDLPDRLILLYYPLRPLFWLKRHRKKGVARNVKRYFKDLTSQQSAFKPSFIEHLGAFLREADWRAPLLPLLMVVSALFQGASLMLLIPLL